MKKWNIKTQLKVQSSTHSASSRQEFKVGELVKILLKNRGLTEKKEIDTFLDPKPEDVTIDSVGIDKKRLKKALARIKKAIEKKEQIVVFGDYDVDGICGVAILWETLHKMGATVTPYIPHRMDEGYGLSVKGIENLKSQLLDIKLIITVDNGIVAYDAVDFANKEGIDVIITDHHVPEGTKKKEPKAFEIVHTTKLCGTGVAYMVSEELKRICHPERSEGSRSKNRDSSATPQNDNPPENHLELVALATVADLVPLQGANRTFVFHGLKKLQKTKRVGLLELYEEAGLDKNTIDTYALGHIIAPRLNAMGRLEYAMDSLRLLCTNNKERAHLLAYKLGTTNKERQDITRATVVHARLSVLNRPALKKLLFLHDESYQQGVIGLVAGRLVEEFYRPAIVISKGEKYSKASARSVHGFNIIEFIRGAADFLVDAGGHPMAAGFTVETEKLHLLQEALENMAEKLLHEDLLIKSLSIDCELPLSEISFGMYEEIQKLAPYGMSNPEPVFASKNVEVSDIKTVGKDKKHLRFRTGSFGAIAFGMGDMEKELKEGQEVDIAYSIDLNIWNGSRKLQLKIKDIKT